MNQGFFQSAVIDQPSEARTSCGISCRLLRGCRSPKMPVTGQGKMKILVIAEAPGENEDKKNIQLIGPAGQVLREALAGLGIDLDQDCRKTNAVRCRPPSNRKPTVKEIITCHSHIDEEIKVNPPGLIIVLGQIALESILHKRWHKNIGMIGRWRGWTIPDQEYKCWICPTFHPSYVLREADNEVISTTFKNDLKNALETVNRPLPMQTPRLDTIAGFRAVLPLLNSKNMTISFDYETTGLRPFYKGHSIICCGVCIDNLAVAFPMTRDTAPTWKKILQSKDIKKIAHNMKFEHMWAVHCLGTETQGWMWDTMQAAHLIDNRKEITSLAFQTYVHFGVSDFKDDTQQLLRAGDSIGGFNSLRGRLPPESLLRRNALDAFYTMQLAKEQWKCFK